MKNTSENQSLTNNGVDIAYHISTCVHEGKLWMQTIY